VDFVLDLLQGLGIAAGVGIRPFLPVLLVGALARGDLGLDFEGTSFAFLEKPWFLLLMLVLVALDYVRERRAPQLDVVWALLAVAVVLGALQGAASLADRDYPIAPGLVGGALAAALGFYAALLLFTRVRRRLDPESQAVLPLYGEGAALASAGLSVLFPPLAILVLGVLVWLVLGSRRRAGEKYAGLRILR
jgi:Domain of unknown function (DUF4126)